MAKFCPPLTYFLKETLVWYEYTHCPYKVHVSQCTFGVCCLVQDEPVLRLSRVVGCSSLGTCSVVFSANGKEVVYPSHAIVVSMDIKTRHQRFFMGHASKVRTPSKAHTHPMCAPSCVHPPNVCTLLCAPTQCVHPPVCTLLCAPSPCILCLWSASVVCVDV